MNRCRELSNDRSIQSTLSFHQSKIGTNVVMITEGSGTADIMYHVENVEGICSAICLLLVMSDTSLERTPGRGSSGGIRMYHNRAELVTSELSDIRILPLTPNINAGDEASVYKKLASKSVDLTE